MAPTPGMRVSVLGSFELTGPDGRVPRTNKKLPPCWPIWPLPLRAGTAASARAVAAHHRAGRARGRGRDGFAARGRTGLRRKPIRDPAAGGNPARHWPKPPTSIATGSWQTSRSRKRHGANGPTPSASGWKARRSTRWSASAIVSSNSAITRGRSRPPDAPPAQGGVAGRVIGPVFGADGWKPHGPHAVRPIRSLVRQPYLDRFPAAACDDGEKIRSEPRCLAAETPVVPSAKGIL